MAAPQRETDIGPPHFEQFLHPIIKKNYGKWKYHETLKPGVMVHVAESGDKIDRKSTRLNSSHNSESRMPSSA
jgi:hypothetical protein